MISHEYKCIFIHQRKAAGLTIISAFGIIKGTPERRTFTDGVLSGPRIMAWSEKEKKFPDYHVFAVARNPWDRFISGWKYCPTTRERPLKDVLQNLPQPGRDKQESHDYRHLVRQQTELIMDEAGHLVTNSIVRFEHLQEDFDKVCDIIGKPRTLLPVTNTTDHEHYTSYYDDESRERVRQMFKDDIKTFNYSFD